VASLNSRLNKKRRYGTYYTPTSISQLLSEWAIRSPSDRVLEPSFGGCGFLETSKARLIALGNRKPNLNLFGCDKDKQAFQYLAKRIGIVEVNGRFILSDFLKLSQDHFAVQQFEVVIGNPPYVSLHNMPKKQRNTAKSVLRASLCNINKRASLWAYFLVHSLRFMRQGGRCAWVLPSSFLTTIYAKQLHEFFATSFERVFIISLRERFFVDAGTDEATVILLADGWKNGHSQAGIKFYHADNIADLNVLIRADFGRSAKQHLTNLSGLVSNTAFSLYTNLLSHHHIKRLGDIADVKIGIVTGANRYFVLNKQMMVEKKIPKTALRPIFAKLNQVHGIKLTRSDLKHSASEGKRCLLLDTTGHKSKWKSVQRYLKSFPAIKRSKILTFKKRKVWHRPDDRLVPDAFLSYMCDHGPRLVLNTAKTTSTNTIHRIFFEKGTPSIQKHLASISLVSTFGQLSAEFEGRRYGAGVLKLEPSEARKLILVVPPALANDTITTTFKRINSLLREGKTNAARVVADRFLFKPILGQQFSRVMKTITQALTALRANRRNLGKEND
jgi:adenine-specific DNA methylase